MSKPVNDEKQATNESQIQSKLKENIEQQRLILQKMRELELEIEKENDERQSVKEIVKVDNISLNPMLKLNEAYLVQLENEEKELLYRLYIEGRVIGRSDKEGYIELDSEYIEEIDEKFGEYGPEYLIQAKDKKLNPEELQEQSVEPQKKSELELKEQDMDRTKEEAKDGDKVLKNEKVDDDGKKQEENNAELMAKMEEDTGLDISACIRIDDENFSQEVLGHQTGHSEKYLGYSRSKNTFVLLGRYEDKFEEIQDLCAAQGGGEAAKRTYIDYDEQGNQVESEAPQFVMTRRDGKPGALAIDMHYGAICLSNLTPSENDPSKYVREEMNIGHSIRPTPDEIQVKMQRRAEREKAIADKEKEVSAKEQDLANGDTTKEDLENSKRELKDMKDKANSDDDDDIYDWSTGKPIPRH